jgi:cytochrome d ubiquinol oxidase subunit II
MTTPGNRLRAHDDMTVRVTGVLPEDFRLRSILARLALGGLTTLTIPIALYQAPLFAQRLLHSQASIFVLLAVFSGIAAQFLLWRRLFKPAQVSVVASVVWTLAGFAAALSPDLLIGQLTLSAAAAPRPTLVAFLAILPFGAAVLVPSLIYLYWTFRGVPDPKAPAEGSDRR